MAWTVSTDLVIVVPAILLTTWKGASLGNKLVVDGTQTEGHPLRVQCTKHTSVFLHTRPPKLRPCRSNSGSPVVAKPVLRIPRARAA